MVLRHPREVRCRTLFGVLRFGESDSVGPLEEARRRRVRFGRGRMDGIRFRNAPLPDKEYRVRSPRVRTVPFWKPPVPYGRLPGTETARHGRSGYRLRKEFRSAGLRQELHYGNRRNVRPRTSGSFRNTGGIGFSRRFVAHGGERFRRYDGDVRG